MEQSNNQEKNFYKAMLAIALPITLQNLISSSLNMVDTIMIGRLGETEIAAVGLANQIFFLFALLLFGTNSGASIFVAQFWGKKDIVNIRRVLGIALASGTIISLIFASAAFIAPNFILSIFTEDMEVIHLGSQYLRIVSFSYFITAISFSYGISSRSIGEAKLPMIVSAVSLVANTILNYLLIFGNLGFPAMGVRGAALATLMSRAIEVSLLLWVIYRKGDVLAAKVHELLDLSYEFVSKFFKTTTPVILNEGLWSLGMVMYSIAYARIGTGAIASIQIANTVQNIFMGITMGLGNACAVMIGNQIGANQEETALTYAKRFAKLGPSLGLVLGILLLILASNVLNLFNISEAVRKDSINILRVMSIFMSFRIFNAILIVGILRSGGDTKFSLFLEMGSVWLVGVPLAFLGALVWGLPVYWVFVLVSLEEILKAAIGIPRLISKKWLRNVVEHM